MNIGMMGMGKLEYLCYNIAMDYPKHLKEANEKRKRNHAKTVSGIQYRKCSICLEWQTTDSFGSDKSRYDGLERRCKTCSSKRALSYHYRHRDKINAYRRSEEYKEYFRPYQNQWLKNKRTESLDFRLRRNLRHRLYRALKGIRKEEKTMELVGLSLSEFKKYLESKFKSGMTWDNYGQPGWEIDHIKPCALFDLTNEEQRKKCFHYTNLQPLWGIENATKKHKYEEDK